MELHEIENWTLKIIALVENKQRIEDSRVELKARWPDAEKAARRIAGLCNASGGASVLWLIGVDEKSFRVTGADDEDLANWYPKVEAQFNGLAPRITDLIVPHAETSVVALLFDTDRRPFVVRNPTYGKAKGGSVSLEVPWREGTRTRSARREDLIRLLSPIQNVPSFEVLKGILTRRISPGPDRSREASWRLILELYVICEFGVPIIIPLHQCLLEMITYDPTRDKATFNFDRFEYSTPQRMLSGSYPARLGPPIPRTENASRTIDVTFDEIILLGPGRLIVEANKFEESAMLDADNMNDLIVNLRYQPVFIERELIIDIKLIPVETNDSEFETHRWEIEKALEWTE